MFGDERCLLLSMRDVTPHYKLRKQQSDLKYLKKLKFTIQKDLEAPLSKLVQHAKQMIREIRRSGIKSDNLNEILLKIFLQSKMSLFRCRDLLEMNTGETVVDQSVFILSKPTESIVKLLELQVKEKHVRFSVCYADADLPSMKFRGDVTKYQQVLLNVLHNAAKFSPPYSEVKLSISSADLVVLQSEKTANVLLTVKVRDFGPGISRSQRKHLFKPFSSI